MSNSRKRRDDAVRDVSSAVFKLVSLVDGVVEGARHASLVEILAEAKRLVARARDPATGWGFVREVLRDQTIEVTKEKYAANRPWTQPSPISPDRLSPAVLNVPETEVKEFLASVVSRYVKTLHRHWITAGTASFRQRGLEPVSDQTFAHYFGGTVMSRFLCPTLDEADAMAFGPALEKRPRGALFKVDFSSLAGMKPFEGLYLTPSVTLWHRTLAGALLPLAIKLPDALLEPQDGEAWELAKYFVLQGAAISLLAGCHPRIHFPADAVNAVTKSALPQHHVVRQLLEPHLYMQLPLNYAVLYIDRSIAHNDQREIYTPFPGPKEGFFKVMEDYYAGVPGNAAYPAWRFPLKADTIHSPYGAFLAAYRGAIKTLTTAVADRVVRGDKDLVRWAQHLSAVLPGFPPPDALFSGETLAETLAAFICDVSVVHSADHYDFARLPVAHVPFRLRVPPPVAREHERLDRRKLVSWEDAVRHRMAHEMYFKTNTLQRLVDVTYTFGDPGLQGAAKQFFADLRAIDAAPGTRKFIPLDEIASSIQY